MSEDRTRDASPRRRLEARQRGLVAHSPELTAAAGLLAGSTAAGMVGKALIDGLVNLIRRPWSDLGPALGREDVSAAISGAWFDLVLPLGAILLATLLGTVLAHQLQVGGVWVPSLLAPDPRRLIRNRFGDWTGAAERGLGGLVRLGAVALAIAWFVRGRVSTAWELVAVEMSVLGPSVLRLMIDFVAALAVAMTAAGLVDWALKRRRLEARLKQTPDEERQERRAVEGDPSLRGRRRRLAWDRRAGEPQAEARETEAAGGIGAVR